MHAYGLILSLSLSMVVPGSGDAMGDDGVRALEGGFACYV